jgi:FdhD protein
MKTVKIVQFKTGKLAEITDMVAEEYLLHLLINSEVSFDVIITPSDIKEFVYGNLFSEGFIKQKDEILTYKENIKKSLINVKVKVKNFSEKKVFLKKNYNIVWTECGSVGEITRLVDKFKPLTTKIKVSGNNIIKIPNLIKDKTELFKQTGAFHYAFLFKPDLEIVTYAFDIGRHNAVDKAFGRLVLNDKIMEISNQIMYVTGRVSSDIVLKCLRANLPIIVSRSAPFDNAIELAEKYNICLIGFLRGKRFNVYSNPDIILI